MRKPTTILSATFVQADGCTGQAVAGSGQIGPYMHLENGTLITPIQATPDYAGTCPYSEVSYKNS